MTESPSVLDVRLAEIDRRLRTIQTGLAPDLEPSIVPPEAAPVPMRLTEAARHDAARAPRADEGSAPTLEEIVAAQEQVLALARRLLAASSAAPAAPIGVSAGPFRDTAALRRFQRSLAALPEVRQVVVREYSGEDHAVLDVHLMAPTP
jgi:hypothetical protein